MPQSIVVLIDPLPARGAALALLLSSTGAMQVGGVVDGDLDLAQALENAPALVVVAAAGRIDLAREALDEVRASGTPARVAILVETMSPRAVRFALEQRVEGSSPPRSNPRSCSPPSSTWRAATPSCPPVGRRRWSPGPMRGA